MVKGHQPSTGARKKCPQLIEFLVIYNCLMKHYTCNVWCLVIPVILYFQISHKSLEQQVLLLVLASNYIIHMLLGSFINDCLISYILVWKLQYTPKLYYWISSSSLTICLAYSVLLLERQKYLSELHSHNYMILFQLFEIHHHPNRMTSYHPFLFFNS